MVRRLVTCIGVVVLGNDGLFIFSNRDAVVQEKVVAVAQLLECDADMLSPG